MIDSIRILSTGCLLLALSSGNPALANDAGKGGTSKSVTVSYAELDLSKPAGVEVLYARLQRAAEQVCGVGVRSLRSLTAGDSSAQTQCYEDALSRTVASLDLEALHRKHAS